MKIGSVVRVFSFKAVVIGCKFYVVLKSIDERVVVSRDLCMTGMVKRAGLNRIAGSRGVSRTRCGHLVGVRDQIEEDEVVVGEADCRRRSGPRWRCRWSRRIPWRLCIRFERSGETRKKQGCYLKVAVRTVAARTRVLGFRNAA